MKNYLLILLTFAIAISFMQCSSDSDKKDKKEKTELAVNEFDSTDLPTSSIDGTESEEQFYLAYKFIEGNTFSYRLTTLSNNKRDIVADTTINNRFEQKIIQIVNFKTVSVEKDSTAELECTITNIQIDGTVNGQKISFKSGEENDEKAIFKFPEYDAMTNNPFHFRITKHGKVLNVFNTDRIINRFLELKNYTDSISTEERIKMQNDLKNNLLRPTLAQILREFPTGEVGIEFDWEEARKPASVMVFKLFYTNHFKVENLEMLDDDRIAIINGSVTTTVEGESKKTENGVNYEYQKPVSTANGKIFFNVDKGLIHKSKTQTSLKLSYRMEMPTPQGIMKGSTNETILNSNILELL